MDSIEDIFTNDIYYPFILYCQAHNYHTMLDLRRCSFEQLANAQGMTAGLLMRIKSMYTAYFRKHPDLLMGRSAPKRPSKPTAAPSPVLAEQLESYFKSHPDTLVRTADLCKDLSLRRNDVSKVLEQASWCKAVDTGTYFYSPQ